MSHADDGDSWDSGPGSPSLASSPLGSQDELQESGDPPGERSSASEEREEEELMSEFRELYKSVGSTMLYDCSTESLNSSSLEDTEKLKARLHSLKRYVYELKESYDELLKAFSLLEIGSQSRVSELEEALASKISKAEDLCTQVSIVQSQLSEAQSQISQVEELNQQLSSENRHLSQEKCGLLELVREKESGVFEQDLGHVLQVISDGISDRVLKLSEVTLHSQTPPFPAKDLPLGPCDCSSTLNSYEDELFAVKRELETRLEDLRVLRAELDDLKAEHETTVEELERSRNSLEASRREKIEFESQLCSTQECVGRLQEEVSLLTNQLNEARDKQQSLSEALETTREAMEHYHTTAQQEVEHKDQELVQLTFELSTLDQKRQSLERLVTDSQQQINNLELARGHAQEDITSLQYEVKQLEQEMQEGGTSTQEVVETFQQTLLDKGLELEALKEEKNQLEKQLVAKVTDLQTQISEAKQIEDATATRTSGYEQQLDSLQSLYGQCQLDAEKLRALLDTKETELSRMLTSLQVAAAQISALHSRGGEETRPLDQVNEELSQCERACQSVERELSGHRQRWEEIVLMAEKHKEAIEELTAKQETLEEELVAKTKRVDELETLVEEVNLSREAMSQTVCEYEESLVQMNKELESTQGQYVEACDEIQRLNIQLDNSSEALDEKEQLLVKELQKRDTLIDSLEADRRELEEKCQHSSSQAEVTERAREALQEEYDHVLQELVTHEKQVQDLEKCLKDDDGKRSQEVERCSQVIQQFKKEMDLLQEQQKASLDVASCAEDELIELRAERSRLVEQLSLRDKALRQLEENTSLLQERYQEAQDEANHERELVESLQEDLAASQGLSDGLQQEVSECERELQELQEKLHANESQRVKLQEQVLELTRDLEAVQDELSLEKSQQTSLQRTTDEAFNAIKNEVDLLGVEQRRSKTHQDLLEDVVEEQKAEIVKLKLAVSTVELQKEGLLFQSSTDGETIDSLKSQLVTLENALQDAQERCRSLEEEFISSRDHCNLVESQLGTANDRLTEVELSKAIVEGVNSERLTEITHLHKQLEEEKVREGLMDELREEIASLESQLVALQEKHDLEVQQSHQYRVAMETENIAQGIALSDLEQELDKVQGYETEAGYLTAVVSDLEDQLTRVLTELEVSKDECLSLRDQTRTTQEKEGHWSRELSQTSAQLQLAQQRADQLLREAQERETLIEELEVKLECVENPQAIRAGKVSQQEILLDLEHQLSEKHQDTLHLEHQLDCCRSDLDRIRKQLVASEDARKQLLERLGSVQEECSKLKGVYSDTVESSNQKSKVDILIDRIREQEVTIAALKSANQELELHTNQSLSFQNQEPSLSRRTSQPDLLSSRDSSSTALSAQPSLTRLTAQLELDFTNVPVSVGVVATTSTIPLTFESGYRNALEKGLTSASCADGSSRCVESETESEAAAHDKQYWVSKVGEVTEQLQETSEFWSQEVRRLSIELEKYKQACRDAGKAVS